MTFSSESLHTRVQPAQAKNGRSVCLFFVLFKRCEKRIKMLRHYQDRVYAATALAAWCAIAILASLEAWVPLTREASALRSLSSASGSAPRSPASA